MMKISIDRIRRTGLVLAAATALTAVLAPTAPAGNRPTSTLPPPEAIRAASANWAAKALLLDANGQPLAQLPPQEAIRAASANWAAKARLLDAFGLPQFAPSSTQAGGQAIDWRDFGIGASATLGLVLLAGGLAVVRFSRRNHVAVRPAA